MQILYDIVHVTFAALLQEIPFPCTKYLWISCHECFVLGYTNVTVGIISGPHDYVTWCYGRCVKDRLINFYTNPKFLLTVWKDPAKLNQKQHWSFEKSTFLVKLWGEILLIAVVDNSYLGVTLCLPYQFVDDSNTQGQEVKGDKKYRQTSTICHRWSSCCRPFLSPCLPPLNISTRSPPSFPTDYIVSIVTPYPHSPRRHQSRPSPNPTQSPLMFYGHCSSKTRFFYHQKEPHQQGTLWDPSNVLDITRTFQRVLPVSSKFWHVFALKCSI